MKAVIGRGVPPEPNNGPPANPVRSRFTWAVGQQAIPDPSLRPEGAQTRAGYRLADPRRRLFTAITIRGSAARQHQLSIGDIAGHGHRQTTPEWRGKQRDLAQAPGSGTGAYS